MFKPKAGPRQPQIVADLCPCRHSSATPVCFLDFLNKQVDLTLLHHREHALEKAAFCPDAVSIFDENYGTAEIKSIGAKGWQDMINPDAVIRTLNRLYWFKKFVPNSMVNKIHKDLTTRLRRTKTAIKESIMTLDGLIIKRIFAFRGITNSYREIAKQTADLFVDLYKDYHRPEGESTAKTVYGELKPFFQKVKSEFHMPDLEQRDNFLYHRFETGSLRRFFQDEFQGLIQEMGILWTEKNVDYVCSTSWIYRCQFLAQTRNLGHLPPCLATAKMEEYIEKIDEFGQNDDSREDVAQLVFRLVLAELPRKAKNMCNKKGKENPFNDVDLTVPPTASQNQTRSMGGKPEDARLILNEAKTANWDIPVRDYQSGRILNTIKVTDDMSTWKMELHWLALEICHKFLIGKKAFGRYWEIDKGTLVGISEPGKLRVLLKLDSFLAWALMPAAKICSSALALDPAHYAGLKASDHAWKFQRRIDSDSQEAGFAYETDGNISEDVLFGFEDWTQATDFIRKRYGVAMLAALFGHIAFPKWYSDFVIDLTCMPIFVEYKGIVRDDNMTAIETKKQFWLRDGYPMGLQMTKVVLHLSHICCDSAGKVELKGQRFTVTRGMGFGRNSIIDKAKRNLPLSVVSHLET
jgi:hypothetical protein